MKKEKTIEELAKDIAIVAYPDTRDLVERRALLVLKTHQQYIAAEVARFIKSKSEQVTKHLWYVSDECLEDVERFFTPL